MKQLLLYLAATAAFIILVGLLTTQNQKIKLVLPTSEFKTTSTVKIGETTVDVKVANTADTRKKGLSGVKSLGANQGLLFVFEANDSKPIFWMKDMNIAIDMIWIANQKVVQIDADVPAPAPGTADKDLKLYPAHQPVEYVLEVNAGFAEERGIAVGDSFEFKP